MRRVDLRPKQRTLNARQLRDLKSVGPATLEDLRVLGIQTVEQLAAEDPEALYARLNRVVGVRHDPCCQDVFASAIAQARDPQLPPEQCQWWYWSKLRKHKSAAKRH